MSMSRRRLPGALTLVGHGVSEEVHDHAGTVFSDRELALLTSAVMAINAWNRLGAPYRFAQPPTANSAAAS
jgi:alkylhydroperoxidase family enzyme